MSQTTITTNHQIQVKTKTSRHQLHNVWLNVESAQPGSKTVSVTTPEGASWRCPRSLVTKVRAKGTGGEGAAVTFTTTSNVTLEARVARLEAEVAALRTQLQFAMAALDGAPSPVGH